MGLSRDEIIDLASRYTTLDQAVDFPFDGDLFCILMRPSPQNQEIKEEEGWIFRGYGICIGYTMDEEAKPLGKWLWMHFASLDTFPPVSQVLKLQPPHVVKGRFQNADRTQEVRLLKMGIGNMLGVLNKTAAQSQSDDEQSRSASTQETSGHEGKIVKFRRKKTSKVT
jgi:hypothetical protein